MREIKFRAWDKKYKTMINPTDSYADYIGFDGTIHEIGEYSNYSGGGKTDEDVSAQYELMQYTGLKDKNGKEGFDSDIVGLEDTLGEQFYGVVKWLGDKKAMYVIEMSGSHYPMSLLSDCEIVGNIYENPELLEVTT